jgi:hypothetical protein
MHTAPIGLPTEALAPALVMHFRPPPDTDYNGVLHFEMSSRRIETALQAYSGAVQGAYGARSCARQGASPCGREGGSIWRTNQRQGDTSIHLSIRMRSTCATRVNLQS